MRKRINLTLTEELYESVKRYSGHMDKPMAASIQEILVEMKPTLDAVSEAMEVAAQNKEEGLQKLKGMAVEKTEEVLELVKDK